VNIGVCGASVIVRFLSMPMMSDNELKGAIRFEAEKFMPFDINDCVIDFQVMRKDARSNNLEIVIAAAKKDYVEERIALVESSGYSVGIVDVDSFAVTNSFLRNVPDAEPEKTVALLNIGSALTNLSIIKGGIAYFVRDIVIGGNDFSVAISKSLNVDIDAAEEIKISPQSRAGEILPSLKASFASLADEIKLSCNYYENQYGKSVDDFYISGGTSDLIEFESIFQEAIGSKPKRWNPTVFLEDNCIPAPVGLKDSVKNSFAVAVGLALRGEDRGRQ
jgi:type IV pilus assembly protein PilM